MNFTISYNVGSIKEKEKKKIRSFFQTDRARNHLAQNVPKFPSQTESTDQSRRDIPKTNRLPHKKPQVCSFFSVSKDKLTILN